jgi:hypothetical protein
MEDLKILEQEDGSMSPSEETEQQSDLDLGAMKCNSSGKAPRATERKNRINKIIFSVLCLLVVVAVGLAIGLTTGSGSRSKAVSSAAVVLPTSEPSKQKEDKPIHHFVDYSCEQDSDCVVMNIGNCCGYYPACLNKTSTPDPSKSCESGGSSICGFPSIEKCVCDLNLDGGRCQASQDLL